MLMKTFLSNAVVFLSSFWRVYVLLLLYRLKLNETSGGQVCKQIPCNDHFPDTADDVPRQRPLADLILVQSAPRPDPRSKQLPVG